MQEYCHARGGMAPQGRDSAGILSRACTHQTSSKPGPHFVRPNISTTSETTRPSQKVGRISLKPWRHDLPRNFLLKRMCFASRACDPARSRTQKPTIPATIVTNLPSRPRSCAPPSRCRARSPRSLQLSPQRTRNKRKTPNDPYDPDHKSARSPRDPARETHDPCDCRHTLPSIIILNKGRVRSQRGLRSPPPLILDLML